MPLRVSVSGIRGVIGDGLDAVVATQWTAAFGAWLPPGPVVVGRDTRPSGPMILRAVEAALLSTGHDVIDIGVASTPTTEMAVQESNAVGGVIITASHNPQPWNALKLLDGQGLFLTAVDNAALTENFDAGSGHVAWDRLGRVSGRENAERQHLDALLAMPWLDRDAIAARGLKVAVDAVEGAGGRIVPDLLEALGVACIPLHCGMSGLFPHPPEPTPAHLAELGEAVITAGADLGFAVDPDVDRLVMVDGTGRLLSEELTLAVAVDFLLGHEPGPVVVNLSTTGLIEAVAAKHDQRALRTPVGEANVVAEMLAIGAVVGGEGNGGVIYPALHPGRDALVGIAMVLQYLTESNQSLDQVVGRYPPVAMIKDKFAQEALFDAEKIKSRLTALGEGDIDDRDGLRWCGVDSWVHMRPSNTEPIVRVIAEAATEAEARKLVARAMPLCRDDG
jgi:phosphomannomutase